MERLIDRLRLVSYKSINEDKAGKVSVSRVGGLGGGTYACKPGTTENSKDGVNHPEDEASFVSKATFSWLIPIMRTISTTGRFSIEDVPPVRRADRSELLCSGMIRSIAKENNTNLAKKMLIKFKWKLTAAFIAILFFYLTPFYQAYLVGNIVSFLHDELGTSSGMAYYSGVMIVLISFALTFLSVFGYHETFKIGVNLRTTLCGIIYCKILEMDSYQLSNVSSGKLLTLISTDVETLVQAIKFPVTLVVGPLVFILAACLLYREIGLPGMTGLLFNIIVTSILLLLAPINAKLRMRTAKATEKRLQMMNEIIRAITVIKMYCWQRSFDDGIKKRRREELTCIAQTMLIKVTEYVHYCYHAVVSGIISAVAITWSGGVLTAPNAARMIGYLDTCGHVANRFCYNILILGEAQRSMKRIEEFLNNNKKPTKKVMQNTNSSEYVLVCTDVTSKWFESEKEGQHYSEPPRKSNFELKGLDIELRKGQLMIIVGQVASGKSSILMTILGHMAITNGSLSVSDSVALVTQESWVFSDTIRENILLGEELNKRRYQNVLDACELTKDLLLLPEGDQTMIGERGLSLSGGQRARISLARAAYHQKELYLLDAPLSSVDLSVGKKIFDRCICGVLSKSARILITHHLQYLDRADIIVVVKNGRIVASGTYDDVLPAVEKLEFGSQSHKIGNTMTIQNSFGSRTHYNRDKHYFIEDISSGRIPLSVYKYLFDAGRGWFTFVPFLILTITSMLLFYASDWYLSSWTDTNAKFLTINVTESHEWYESSRNYMLICTGCIICVLVIGTLSTGLFLLFSLLASKNLHIDVYRRVVGAKLTFFDKTAVGMILNRFSRDLGLMDSLLFSLGAIYIIHGIKFVGFIAMSGVVVPWLLIVIIPYIIFIMAMRHVSMASSREFKRIEAKAKSPLFSHFSNTLDGHVSIKCFGKTASFIKEHYELQDIHTSANYLLISSARWLNVYLGLSSTVFLAVTIVASFFMADKVNGSLLGIVLARNITISNLLKFILMQSTEMENALSSVERLYSYTNLEQEEMPREDTIHLRNVWPPLGTINFINVSLCYKGCTNYSLNNFSFTIMPGEKIGIAGRTGAGKSSLFKTLLRLEEYEGKITIDGVDIMHLKLDDLRKRISIIPQDPVLFSATLRENMDPLGEYNDPDIWRALEQVEMRDYVKGLGLKLDAEAGEGGCNFSVGQKQLLCLARALLRKSKIILIDEATANVDPRTDILIQKKIRTLFKISTVLTIAHRLQTILDSDRIMVLGEGKLRQFDKPDILKSDPGGHFYNMLNGSQIS